MTTTSHDVEARRENSRENSGQFGSQQHPVSEVKLSAPAASFMCQRCEQRDAESGTFLCAECTLPDESTYFTEEPPPRIPYVDPFPGRGENEEEWDPCGRCGGEGVLEQFKSGMDGGVCFECHGGKGQMSTVGALRTRKEGQIKYKNRKIRELHKSRMLHNANYRRAIELNPHAEAWRHRINTDSFLSDLWWQAFKRDLSEKQLAAIGRTFTRDFERTQDLKAKADALPEVPEGRYMVSGQVIRTRSDETAWGTVMKMTVIDDRGFKVYGTVPNSLLDQTYEDQKPLTGRKITLTAQVTPGRENGFGFFSRPTKAKFTE